MSTVSDFLALLNEFDLRSYEEKAHRLGRQNLADDSRLVEQIRNLTRAAEGLRGNSSVVNDKSLRNIVEVSARFARAQDYILHHAKPRYEPYASIQLLRHVLGIDARQSLAVTERRIWLVFREVVRAQLDFEMESLSGLNRYEKQQFDPAVSRARFEALRGVQALVPSRFALTSVSEIVQSGSIEHIAEDPTGASTTRRLLVFPQTTCHDEVAFLNLILMGECLFWGTLMYVKRALAAFHLGQVGDTIGLVRKATSFATPLIKVFQAVKTMPPDHFLGFREATGEASAIQSQSWQLLDAHMYGVLPEKAPILERVAEVRHVLRLANPNFLPLAYTVADAGTSTDDEELRDCVVELDHKVRAWRTFHTKQLAGRKNPSYLPPAAFGSGGTSGYDYLAAHRPPRPARTSSSPASAHTEPGAAEAV